MENKNNFKNDLGKLDWYKNLWNLIGMGLGVLCIIFGLVTFGNTPFHGSYPSMAFGADFYTEIHKATSSATTALREIFFLLRSSAGFFFVILGGTDICFFGSRLVLSKKQEVPTEDAAECAEEPQDEEEKIEEAPLR